MGPPATAAVSIVINVASADDVSNACEVARDMAHQAGFPHVAQTKIATAVAELARNIVLYARAGEVRIRALESPRRGIEVLAKDNGPGIANLDAVLGGKYRSRTGMGMGLLGAKRLMDAFEVETSTAGTAVLVRKFVA
jgi:serine/threonine-protein kinase RsbT